MVFNFFTKIFGSSNDRKIKKLQPIIDQINNFESDIKKMSDEQFRQKT